MTPQKEINGIVFFPIPEFEDNDVAFGADTNRFFDQRTLPNIPAKFDDMACGLFYDGGALPETHPSVDRKKAARALRAWLGSFSPSHESKMATVGYALWLWTDPTVLDGEKCD